MVVAADVFQRDKLASNDCAKLNIESNTIPLLTSHWSIPSPVNDSANVNAEPKLTTLEVSHFDKSGLKLFVFDANAGWKLAGRYLHDGDLARILGLEERQVLVVPKGAQADLIAEFPWSLSDRLNLHFAVGATWADSDYMQAYFGVTPAQATATKFSVYTPKSGLRKGTRRVSST